MIRFKTAEGNILECGIAGNITELLSDLCLEIAYIHSVINKQNSDAAKQFKDVLLGSLNNKEFAADVFSGDLLGAEETELSKKMFAVANPAEAEKDKPAPKKKASEEALLNGLISILKDALK